VGQKQEQKVEVTGSMIKIHDFCSSRFAALS
jgi:hypothetical protein